MPSIQAAYQWCVNTCNAPNVGYSNAYREQRTIGGITYYDCSSLIWYALRAGGFPVESYTGSDPFYTYTMIPILLAMGFVEVSIYGEWKAGDIAWRSGHVEMVYSGGMASGVCMGAHGTIADGYPLPDQVSIDSYTATPGTGSMHFSRLFRYGDGADGEVVEGVSIYVISAILGNWWAESRLNPLQLEYGTQLDWEGLRSDGYGGYGFGQWTNTSLTNMRLKNLHDYMVTHMYEINTPQGSALGELNFFIYEDTWYTHPSLIYSSEYADLEEFLQSTSTNITELTHAFTEGWEGIHDSSWDTRVTYANNIYNYLLSHGNDQGLEWQGIFSNQTTINESASYINAVLIYQYLSTGGGGGGINSKRKGLKVWQMIRYRFL